MAGLVPAIHAAPVNGESDVVSRATVSRNKLPFRPFSRFQLRKRVDGRDKPGHDASAPQQLPFFPFNQQLTL
jgi:hypothetical protein